jgi:hypothetical protein
MANRRRPRPGIALPALLSHAALTALVWRDIARRSPAELRGSKNIWRVLTAMNTGNHLLYLLVGRRPSS